MTEIRWTPEQSAAIQCTDHAMIAASAGTGKTTTLIGKVIWQMGLPMGNERDTGWPINPYLGERLALAEVAAITFTEKAAFDLKLKLRERIDRHAPHQMWEIERAYVGTIHGFCGDLLRQHAVRFGIDPTFRVLDEREARLELDEIIKDVALQHLAAGDEGVIGLVQQYRLTGYEHTEDAVSYTRSMLRDLRWHEERYKSWSARGELDAEVLWGLVKEWDTKDDPPLEACATIFRLALEVKSRWEAFQQQENVRDFDSLVLDARTLLEDPLSRPALRGIQKRLRLLMIDEFQDADEAQRDIVFAIAGIVKAGAAEEGAEAESQSGVRGDGPQLLLVGDPGQCIYRFRGADISVWNSARKAIHGDAEPLKLTENFRSDERVVHFVNTVCAEAVGETAAEIAKHSPESRTDYEALRAARHGSPSARVEWLAVEETKTEARRKMEAELVATRIRNMVEGAVVGGEESVMVEDADSGQRRPCLWRDIAIIFRNRHPLGALESALQRLSIPYYLAGDAGLSDRQEILDLITVLRLLDNPRDDMAAFAFLRSPLVGLRDEVITRMRLDAGGGTLLRQAREYQEQGEWFESPEHPLIVEVEKEALRIGIDTVDSLIALRTRIPVDELLEEALDRTGYRAHVQLLDQPAPKLANIDRFLRLLRGYRHHTVGTFLELWDRWETQDLGIPQAPLFSKRDDVVTLTTVHSAKGLEWPIVFLVDADGLLRDRATNRFWTDRALGPVLCPKQDARGARTRRAQQRWTAEERAEEARLLYVAATRARDRLVIAGPREGATGVAEWLNRGVDLAVRQVNVTADPAPPPSSVQPTLAWLDRVERGGDKPALLRSIRAGSLRATRSSTELMMGRASRTDWTLRYIHGVVPQSRFAPARSGPDGVPADVHGRLVHGVLERIRDEAELAELLDLAIGALDVPELQERMAAGTEYRVALAKEIKAVVTGDDWKWYVEGEHSRELPFVHFRHESKWRVGAFDLYRPGDPEGWIVDFKTHDIDADEAAVTADRYVLQGAVYRRAAAAMRYPVTVRLHFTRPNTTVDL